MISFIPKGRLGNFFMECATALSYSIKHGIEFSVPTKTSHPVFSPIYLHHLQNKNFNPLLPSVIIQEKQFHFYELPFEEIWRDKNIILNGYFQSHLRFDEYRKEILEAFDLPYQFKSNTASIHARYGDYLTIPNKHIIVDESYLKSAMSLITESTGITNFKVFSDDISLFKQRHGNLYDFEYSTNTSELDDLIEISCCHSQINSSSTFSWWGGWLNQNPDKIIITQCEWFQSGWKEDTREVLTDDVVPSNWIKL